MADKNLVARIILSATDKASDALNRVRLNANGLTRSLATLQQRQRSVVKTQALARSYRDVSRELNANGVAIKNQQNKLRMLAASMAAVKQPTKAMARQYKALTRDIDVLIKRKQRLSGKVSELSERLKKAGFDTKNFASSYQTLKKRLNDSTAEINKQKAALERLGKARAGLDKARGLSGKAMTVALRTGAAASAIGFGLGASVRAGMSEEDAMLGIVKQVGELKNADNSLNHEAIRAMRLEVQALSRELPLTTVEIMQMYAAGARMDTPRNELASYVKTAAQAAVAFDSTNVEELAESLGKINKNFKLSAEQGRELADVINYIDDNAISKGGDIISYMNTVAGIASIAKMNAKNMAALGSTLMTLGATESEAAIAVSSMFVNIGSALKHRPVKDALQQIGLDAKQIQEGMAKDAQSTIMKIVEALRKTPASQRTPVMEGLVNKYHVKTLSKLVDNTEEWRRQIALANSEMANGSMNREFEVRMQAASSKWQILKNQFFNVNAAAGSALFVSLNAIMDKMSSLLTLVAKWQQKNPQTMATIMKTVAILGGLLAVITGIALAIGAVVTPFAMLRMAVAAFNVTLLANPMVLIITAVIAAIILLIVYWDKVKSALIKGWQWINTVFSKNPILNFLIWPIGLMRLLINNWDALKSALINGWHWLDQAFSNNPILNVIFPVIGAVRVLINNWGQIGPFFSNLWSSVCSTVSNAISSICSVVMNAPLVQVLAAIWNAAINYLSGFYGRLYEVGSNLVQGLIDGVKARLKKLQEVWQKVASLFDGTMRKTNDIHSPSRLMARLGGYIMQGLTLGVQKGRAALSEAYYKAVDFFQQPISATADMIYQTAGVLLPLGASPSPSVSSVQPPLVKTAGGGCNNYYITVNVASNAGLSGQRIGNDIAAALQQHQAAQERRARGSMWDKD